MTKRAGVSMTKYTWMAMIKRAGVTMIKPAGEVTMTNRARVTMTKRAGGTITKRAAADLTGRCTVTIATASRLAAARKSGEDGFETCCSTAISCRWFGACCSTGISCRWFGAARQSAADGVGARAVLVHHTTHSVPHRLSANTLRPRKRQMHSLQVSEKLNECRVHQQSD